MVTTFILFASCPLLTSCLLLTCPFLFLPLDQLLPPASCALCSTPTSCSPPTHILLHARLLPPVHLLYHSPCLQGCHCSRYRGWFVMPVLGHVPRHVLRHVLGRHMPEQVLEHMPGHVLRHMPDRHVPEHVQGHVPQNRHHEP